MSYFVFNNIDSRDLGLILPDTPFRPSWAEEVEEITIAGRPEVIKNPNGTYGNQSLQINAVITDTANINTIYSVLHGEGKLVLSTAPNEYINCRVNPLIPKGVALDMAELPITFDCYPFAYSTTPTTISLSTVYTEVINNSNIYTAPLITIHTQPVQSPILKGDVNFDGRITTVDATLVLTEVARLNEGLPGTFTPQQFQAADMNNDNRLTVIDASLILQLCRELSKGGGEGEMQPTTPTETVTISVNGQDLIVGLPAAVTANGFDVYVDSELFLIYYVNADGDKINILNYSTLDLPLLHSGSNYVKYSECEAVTGMTITVNERWL